MRFDASPAHVPNNVLGLVLPEGDADEAFTLAHGETNMRLRGERAPPFEEIVGGETADVEVPQRRRIHVQGHYVYRVKETGRFTSKRKWARSHGPKGKYVRAWQPGYYYYREAPAVQAVSAGELPSLPAARGPFDTLAEAHAAFPAVQHGAPLAGPALDRRLKALGLDPLRLTIQGAFSRVQGGPLELWEADGEAVGGLSLATYPGLLDQITRDWREQNDSPPVILVARLGVGPLDA